jgi:hypothetical protein
VNSDYRPSSRAIAYRPQAEASPRDSHRQASPQCWLAQRSVDRAAGHPSPRPLPDQLPLNVQHPEHMKDQPTARSSRVDIRCSRQASVYELPGAVVFVAQQHRHSPVALHGRAEILGGQLHELANAEAAPVTAIEVEGDQVTTPTDAYQSVRLDCAAVRGVTPAVVVEAPLVFCFAAGSGDCGLRSCLSRVLESALGKLQCLRIR